MKRTVLLLILLAGLATPARPESTPADAPGVPQDDYQAGDFGRVRFLENGATVLRSASEAVRPDEDTVDVNDPLFPGDRVVTDRDQRLEIQLAVGSLVRVDRETDLTLQALPDASAQYSDNTVLKLVAGTLQIATRVRDTGEFHVDTPACSVYLLGEGDWRIDVDRAGRTRVAAKRGVAEVVGDDGSVIVRGGMRTTADPGSVPDDPRSFNAFAADGFDTWVAEREIPRSSVSAPNAAVYEAIPNEVRPYYRELDGYGRWVYLPTYGYAWYPYDRDPGWRPYLDGSWYYGPRGYFWVSSEPWGWAPYHYGRWTWAGSYGWCWIPGRVFGGAWVSWSWGSTAVGWCPLDYWNRPAFHGTLYYGLYDPSCWTFVDYQHVGSRDYRRHAVPIERIGGALRTAVVVTRPPRVAPGSLAASVELRQRAVRAALEDRQGRVDPLVNRRQPVGPSFSQAETDLRRGVVRKAPPRSFMERAKSSGPIVPPRPGVRRLGETLTIPEPRAPQAEAPLGGDPSPRGAGEKLRDLYRRMASPRITRPAEPQPPAAHGGDEAARARQPAPTPRPGGPAARPRPPGPPPAPRKAAPPAPRRGSGNGQGNKHKPNR